MTDADYYWSKDDEAWMHANAANVTATQAGRHFGCQPYVARRKADRMGLSFQADPTAKNLQPTFKTGDHSGAWTEARFQAAKKLWLEGLSAAQIAKELACGFSRMAVLGKMHRAGLSSPGSPHATTPRRAPRPPKPPVVAKPAPAPKAPAPAPRVPPAHPILARAPEPEPPRAEPEPIPLTADLIPLEHLNARTCKWPFGDPQRTGFGFCGCPKDPEAVYCADHARLAYVPNTKERKRASARLYAYVTKAA